MYKQSIILASQSPRRKQLLEQAAIPFTVVVIPTEETYPAELPIEEIPIYIAKQKAIAIQQLNEANGKIVLAADTVVVLEKEIIGKPKDEADAVAILQKLSGKEHQVITGVYMTDGNKEESFSCSTSVNFNTLTFEQIVFYVQHYKPFDKAGAYAIQEWIGAVGIASITGDFYNVMGLPINRVVQVLAKW